MEDTRISLLHLSLAPGALDANLAMIERGIGVAAQQGANLIITPELSISGYQFTDEIGTSWIGEQPDPWMRRVCELARHHKTGILLGHVERDYAGKLYNSAFLIGPDGAIMGRQRKVNPAAEAWATRGEVALPLAWNGLSIGILTCSDAYPQRIAAELCERGVQLFVCPCAWRPGLQGPAGEWESRSRETELPLIVCNRTGREATLDFSKSESLVIDKGERVLSHSSDVSAVLTFDFNSERMQPRSTLFDAIYIE